ncbi:MAG: hypothetical protein RLZZ299_2243 [Pseudomonadota bacterium]
MWMLLLACQSGTDTPPAVAAIVDRTRATHFLDVPFPSDTMRGPAGQPDLTGFPTALQPLAAGIVDGWARRVEAAAHGTSNNGAAYFRFEDAVAFPTATEGRPDDPVAWVAMDGSEVLPLLLRFVDDPAGDPFYAPHTLAMAPALGHPPRPGVRYAAVVMESAGVRAPDGYTLPEGVAEAVATAGLVGPPAVATVFTVQDTVGELRSVYADVDARMPQTPSLPTFRRVVRLEYRAGTTPSGKEASLAVVTYEDGSTDTTYLEPDGITAPRVQVFDESWPMVVYEGQVPTWNYQGLADRPYMNPGLAHVSDTDRMTGWIRFDGDTLVSEPERETMRVTISIPRTSGGAPRTDAPWLMWDHGTGGHAYEPVQRLYGGDDGRAFAQVLADAGWAVVGRDAALYGQRYPLIDEGFGASLGFYNVVNPPAFRDNLRQTAVDGHALLRWIEGGAVNAALPAGSLDPARRRRAGHSLGSVTANLGVSAEPDAWEALFLSGSGGNFSHYFLDTGLLGSLDPSLLTALYGLVGQPVPEDVTPATALGAILGVPEAAWGHIDRLHPAIGLFQWQMDGGDPMAVARAEALPARMLVCTDDWQVPNFTSWALLEAMPDAAGTEVSPTYAGDHHTCLWRDPRGNDVFEAFFASGR